jgi:hypothetical protein
MIKSSSVILIFIIIIVWLIYLFPKEAVAPGDLLENHSRLEDNCLSCHTVFFGPSGGKCLQCHTPEKTNVFNEKINIINVEKKPLSFHYKLTANSCVTCHKEHKGRFVKSHAVQFSHEIIGIEEPNNCTACHQRPVNYIHQQASQNCTKCHDTSNWTSAEFDLHTAYFKFDRDHKPGCITCHPGSNYKTYTCYGCHEHSEQKIERKHIEEGIPNNKNCAECHPSGDEHDIRKTGREKSQGVESRDDGIRRRDKKSEDSSYQYRKSKRRSDNDDHDDHDDEKDDH